MMVSPFWLSSDGQGRPEFLFVDDPNRARDVPTIRRSRHVPETGDEAVLFQDRIVLLSIPCW